MVLLLLTFLFIVTPIVGVCNCSMFCCTLLYVHSSIAIILMGKRKLIALLNLSSWCLVMVERFFLAVPRGCLQFVIVVFPDHTHLLYFWFISIRSIYPLTDILRLKHFKCRVNLEHRSSLVKFLLQNCEYLIAHNFYICFGCSKEQSQ